MLIIASLSLRTTLSLKGAWSLSHDLFNFWKISDNISKTVQDSFVVSIKQGSHKPGKPGIVREFCKPGKVREFAI